MISYRFDDRHITWRTLEGIEHLEFAILDIDQPSLIADIVFKFAAHQPIILHRHLAVNHMWVVQGEHRLFYADGSLKEIRPVGRYTRSQPSPEPHRECGGDEGAVVLFSIRGSQGVLYELLDDDEQCVGTLSWQDVLNLAGTK